MRLHNDTALVIEASEDFKERQFSIKASPAAFQILSSGLYQDKIAAVIREISTNAYDGHVAAEKAGKLNQTKVPFDVTLPTSLSPVFKVRDYGTGLREDLVFELYTTYFGSTKQDSDDFIGALGLGSKSPFSLVSSFMVVSYCDQIKTIYSAIIGEDGFPSIVKMHEELTDEPSGMEISLTVSSSDIQNFAQRAAEIYKYFDVKPNIKGNKITIPEIKYSKTGKRWGIVDEYRYNNDMHAIQGQVRYTISLEALSGQIDAHVYSFYEEIGNKLDLRFNIGDVEIQASREALSYNQRTIRAIESVLRETMEDLSTNIVDTLKKCENYLEACKYINNLQGYERYLSTDIMSRGLLKWKKREIVYPVVYNYKEKVQRVTHRMKDPLGVLANHYTYPKFSKDWVTYNGNGDLMSVSTKVYEKDHEFDPKFPNSERSALRFTREISAQLSVGGKTYYVINDAKLPIYKIRDTIRANTKYHYYDAVWVFTSSGENHLKSILKIAAIDEFEKTSDWDVVDIERKKLLKGIRTFKPKALDYKGQLGYYNSEESALGSVSSRFSTITTVAQITDAYKWYVVAEGGAYSFIDPFSGKSVKALTINRYLQAFAELGIMKTDHQCVLVLAKSIVDDFNKLYPNIKDLRFVLDDVKWSDLDATKQVEIAKIVDYNDVSQTEYAFNYHNDINPYESFFDLIIKKSQNINLYAWANTTKVEFARLYEDIKSLDVYNKCKHYKQIVHILAAKFMKNIAKVDVGTGAFNNLRKDIDNIFPLRVALHEYLTTRIHYGNTDQKIDRRAILVTYFEREWEERSNKTIDNLTKEMNV